MTLIDSTSKLLKRVENEKMLPVLVTDFLPDRPIFVTDFAANGCVEFGVAVPSRPVGLGRTLILLPCFNGLIINSIAVTPNAVPGIGFGPVRYPGGA
jgi:hypothetical protein